MLTWRVLALLAAVSATLLLGGWAWQVREQTSESEEDHRRGGSGPVTLGITGDDGTLFAGTCSVGEDERDVGGRVPRSFEFDLQGGELRIVLIDENSRSVHRSVGGGESETRFVYEEGGISSMSSSTSQTMSTTTQGSSTFLTVNDEDRERGSGRPSLADRIQEDVGDSIERAMPWLRN